MSCPTSNVTGPDDGVASPRLFVGVPLLHLLNLNRLPGPVHAALAAFFPKRALGYHRSVTISREVKGV